MTRERSYFGRGRGPLVPLLRVVLLTAVLWMAGLIVFAETLSRQTIDPADGTLERTQAIAVLTGGSDRLEVGFALLASGRADKLFISGVYRGVDVQDLLRLSQEAPAELACCIVLGHDAEDTRGNAVETARWMRAEGFTTLRLVTANYHMPRSMIEFRRAMPDATILPHPVAPANVRLDRWFMFSGTTELILNEYNKYLLAALRAGMDRILGREGVPDNGTSAPPFPLPTPTAPVPTTPAGD